MKGCRRMTVSALVIMLLSLGSVKAGDRQTPAVLIEARIVEVHQDVLDDLGIDYQFRYTSKDGRRSLEVITLPVGDASNPGKWTTERALLITDRGGTIEPDSTDIIFRVLESRDRDMFLVRPRMIPIEDKKFGDTKKGCDSLTGASPQQGHETSAYNVDENGWVTVNPAGGAGYSRGRGYDLPGLVGVTSGNYPSFSEGQDVTLTGLKSTFNLDGVPGLGEIPDLSFVFKSEIRDKTRGNLMVVVTPVIIREE